MEHVSNDVMAKTAKDRALRGLGGAAGKGQLPGSCSGQTGGTKYPNTLVT